jgi:mono/diheme cytochrome c family protein
MRRACLIVLALLLPLLVVACGGEETIGPLPETVEGTVAQATTETGETGGEAGAEGDPEAGAEVFASAGCGGCHTLEDAGTNGNVGPNLDESQPPLELVIDRVTNGAGVMPAFKDQLDEQQIADVSAYVVQATGG